MNRRGWTGEGDYREVVGRWPEEAVTTVQRLSNGRRRGALARPGRYGSLPGTIRGSNTKRFGLRGSMRALTQWVLREPKVSTRVKFASTPPPVERLRCF